MSEMKTFFCSERQQWRDWLSGHFETEKEIWFVFSTKDSGEKSISYNDAVEEALCFGWIDGRAGTLDETHQLRRFTPRKKGSSYSQPNIERLIRLDAQGMIHPKIRPSVEALISAPFVYPEDILDEIRNDETAWKNFNSFTDPYRRIRIAYIDAARKRPAEFEKRLINFIRKTRENKLITGYGGIDQYYGQAGNEPLEIKDFAEERNMIKNIAIVSLSAGTIGEAFVKHELEIGIKRLEDFGLNVKFMPHALKGIEYVKNHPEERAADLLQAFRDPEIDMILCAIGGDDTYRLLPYLFDHGELAEAVSNKVFLGFSDTTVNHFMLRKAGLNTFYGQSFLADVCELDKDMLPYTKKYFEELIRTGTIREIRPGEVWYEERKNFGIDQIGTSVKSHPDLGFELLQGSPVFSGEILGGCIDSMYDFFSGARYADMPVLCRKYGLFPKKEEWNRKILLLETSEEKMPPQKYREAIAFLKETGVFDAVSGVLIGKPIDRIYEAEYKQILKEEIDDPDLPIVCNINIGHAKPRCIIPFGVRAEVDVNDQVIRFAG